MEVGWCSALGANDRKRFICRLDRESATLLSVPAMCFMVRAHFEHMPYQHNDLLILACASLPYCAHRLQAEFHVRFKDMMLVCKELVEAVRAL